MIILYIRHFIVAVVVADTNIPIAIPKVQHTCIETRNLFDGLATWNMHFVHELENLNDGKRLSW